MSSRHRAREVALQILYRYDVARSSGTSIPEGVELATDIRKHFDHFVVPENLREFSAELVAGAIQNMSVLDTQIEETASNWKVARMTPVDRSLLRMAIYELTRFPDIAPSIILNESIELAKQFGSAESPSFINGVLDALKGTIRVSPLASLLANTQTMNPEKSAQS